MNSKTKQLEDENRQLREENERLQAWVDDLKRGFYVNCVYCGHRYGPANKVPVTMHEMLYEHISKCPKHPLSRALAEISLLEVPDLFLVRLNNSRVYTICHTLEASEKLALAQGASHVRCAHELAKHPVGATS